MKKEQCLVSDYFDEKGLKENDYFWVNPTQGKKNKYKLLRTKFDICSENLGKEIRTPGMIKLPCQKNEKFHIEVSLEDFIGRNHQKKQRYLILVKKGNAIRLNGNYVFSAYLEHFDEIEIGFNTIKFFPSDLKEDSNTTINFLEQRECFNLNTQLPILIEGETGVGKSSLARKIHESSHRVGRFINLNIAAYNPNLLESELFGHLKGSFTGALNDKKGAFRDADKGTLFIDEIDSLPIEVQTKLLLFLDDFTSKPVGSSFGHKVDIKLILSSGSPLKNLVEKGKMRKDFYFRVSSGFRVKISPLREKPKVVEQFCLNLSFKHNKILSKELLDFYQTLPWPGNYRQLKGHLLRKFSLSKSKNIGFDSFDEDLICQTSELFTISSQAKETLTLKEVKVKYAQKVFLENKKNYQHAAQILGISSRSLRTLVGNIETTNQQYKEY